MVGFCGLAYVPAEWSFYTGTTRMEGCNNGVLLSEAEVTHLIGVQYAPPLHLS